jgi:cytochrome c-type biogenesis protein CcmH/NrfF
VLGGVLCLWAAPVFAQGCAMCYSTASATSKDGQKAISRGVAVLVAPPLGVMTLGVGLAFRYGRKRDQEQDRENDRRDNS